MRPFICIAIAGIASLIAGCSFLDGIRVEIRREAVDALRSDLLQFLAKKDFQVEAHASSDTSRFVAIRRTADGEKISLFATFYAAPEKPSFFVGKGNSRRFTPDEIAIVDQFAAFLADRPESIVAGSASKASTSEPVRHSFYTKIKKA